jgi:cytochrome bd ubiquinol oxidase subunit II
MIMLEQSGLMAGGGSRADTRAWVRCLAGAVPSLLMGVAVGNLFLGIPLTLDTASRVIYSGGVLNLLSPFALLCGVVSLTMMILNGACYAARKTNGEVETNGVVLQRAAHTGIAAAGLFVIAFVASGVAVMFWLEGYRIIGDVNAVAAHPHMAAISHSPGAWLDNYVKHPWLWSAPLAALIGASLACWALLLRWTRLASVASYIVFVGTMVTAAFALFPFLAPSSNDANQSLLVWVTSRGLSTLRSVVLTAILSLPFVAAYMGWLFRAMQDCINCHSPRSYGAAAIKEHP